MAYRHRIAGAGAIVWHVTFGQSARLGTSGRGKNMYPNFKWLIPWDNSLHLSLLLMLDTYPSCHKAQTSMSLRLFSIPKGRLVLPSLSYFRLQRRWVEADDIQRLRFKFYHSILILDAHDSDHQRVILSSSSLLVWIQTIGEKLEFRTSSPQSTTSWNSNGLWLDIW